jgi:hypothetical protein
MQGEAKKLAEDIQILQKQIQDLDIEKKAFEVKRVELAQKLDHLRTQKCKHQFGSINVKAQFGASTYHADRTCELCGHVQNLVILEEQEYDILIAQAKPERER